MIILRYKKGALPMSDRGAEFAAIDMAGTQAREGERYTAFADVSSANAFVELAEQVRSEKIKAEDLKLSWEGKPLRISAKGDFENPPEELREEELKRILLQKEEKRLTA